MKRQVAVILGSLRRESYSRSVALAAESLAPASLGLAIVEIGDLPLYNPDHDGEAKPASWTRFRNAISETDAVLFVSPEYNRSAPAALKNAIDIGSRPEGKSVWSGKPSAIITLTPGALGTFGADHHAREALIFAGANVLQRPESYISKVRDQFDADRNSTNAASQDFLKDFLGRFDAWIDLHGRASCEHP